MQARRFEPVFIAVTGENYPAVACLPITQAGVRGNAAREEIKQAQREVARGRPDSIFKRHYPNRDKVTDIVRELLRKFRGPTGRVTLTAVGELFGTLLGLSMEEVFENRDEISEFSDLNEEACDKYSRIFRLFSLHAL